MVHPLSQVDAKAAIAAILADPRGFVSFTKHALDELKADGLWAPDALNVLRAGWVSPAEFENGAWRYRVSTNTIEVVVEIESDTDMLVITGWRIKK